MHAVMVGVVLAAALGFSISALLSRVLAGSASSLWPRDQPNARSLHSIPMPRTGGLAILLGLAASLTAARLSGVAGRGPLASETLWLVAASLLLAVTSFVDDRRGLSPALRISLQATAAAAVVYGAHLVVREVALPGLGTVSLGWAGSILSLLGLLWMTNLYNFMDGMDGFAGGMTVIGGAFLGAVFLRAGDQEPAFVAFLLAAAAGGFLMLNWPPARLFMGDVGSVTIGFLVGTLALKGASAGSFEPVVPLLIFAPFVVDATLTLLRRLVKGERVWQAHRSHYYQRLVLAGWSHRKTTFAEYGLMAVCGLGGLLYGAASPPGRTVLFAGVTLIALAAIGCVHRIEKRARLRAS